MHEGLRWFRLLSVSFRGPRPEIVGFGHKATLSAPASRRRLA